MRAFRLIRADQLSADQLARWSELQRADPALSSPYFRPEFTQAVARIRDDVEVCLFQQDGKEVGFFPFQRGRHNVGKPVGGVFSDFQGVVAAQGVGFRAEELLGGCRLSTWNFNHLIATQEPFRPYHVAIDESPYMDLSGGFDAYYQQRRQSGSTRIKRLLGTFRRAERELGPIRLEPHVANPEVLDKLIGWRVGQYEKVGGVNFLAPDWTRRLLHLIAQQQGEAFSGQTSALYAGDRLISAHFGMQSHGVLHWWFVGYDPAGAQYSPGLLLLLGLAQAAEALGIRRIDLGKGQEPYKLSLQTGAVTLAEGSVGVRRVSGALRRSWIRTRERVRSSPLRAPAQYALRKLRAHFWVHD